MRFVGHTVKEYFLPTNFLYYIAAKTAYTVTVWD